MILSLMVAYVSGKNGAKIIGKDNKIPWDFPHDLERFKEYTSGSTVIMGRKTHESIGRVLPDRDHVIVTHQKGYEVSGAYVFHNLEDALKFGAMRHSEVFIIGGQSLYEQTIHRAHRLYLTSFKIKGITGDTFFPDFEEEKFRCIHTEKSGISGDCFRILERLEYSRFTQTDTRPESAALAEALSNPYVRGTPYFGY